MKKPNLPVRGRAEGEQEGRKDGAEGDGGRGRLCVYGKRGN